MYRLAKDLGLTIKDVMKMTTANLWDGPHFIK